MNIKLKNVTKIFKTNDFSVTALNDINLNFESGKIYFLCGPSGSGKSTLLSLIGCLDEPTYGHILFNEQTISNKCDFINKNISFVFQDFNLFENMTVYENLCMYENDKNILKEMLNKFECQFSLNANVNYLSGGERQRLAILRSYLKDSDILLLDEPTGNLDKEISYEILNLIKKLQENKIIIVVTHDESLANFYGDEIIYLSKGEIIKITSPKNEFLIDLKDDNDDQFASLYASLINYDSLSLLVNNKQINIERKQYYSFIDEIKKNKFGKKVNIKFLISHSDVPISFLHDKKFNFILFLRKFAFKNVINKFGRTLFTFLATSFMFCLLFLLSNLVFYDVGYYVHKQLNENGIEYSALCYEERGQIYNNGLLLHSYIENNTNYYPSLVFRINHIGFEENRMFFNFNVYFTNNDYVDVFGQRYELEDDKILLTDYVKSYEGDFTSLYALTDGTYICPTISDSTIITNKQHIINQESDIKAAIGFMKYSYFCELFKSCELLRVRAPQKIGSTTSVEQLFEKYDNEQIINGSAIENDNEILIGSSFAKNWFGEQDIIGKEIDIYDISHYDKKTIAASYYDLSKINTKLIIKGIVDDSTSIFVSSNYFDDLISQKKYSLNVSINVNEGKSHINYLYENNIYFASSIVSPIYSFATTFRGQGITLALIIFIILLIVTSIMLSNWITNIIKDKYKDIAILRSLGFNKKQINMTFIMTVSIFVFMGLLISFVLGILGTILINYFAISGFLIQVNTLFTFNVFSFLIPIIFAPIYCVVVSLCFLNKINKTSTLHAIKKYKQ